MTKIEACELIIYQDGSCNGIKCEECPGFELVDPEKCLYTNMLAKQYLAEHKQESAEDQEKTYPVEFTESELYYLANATFLDTKKLAPIMKKYVEALKKINEPQIGDRCAFWDNDRNGHILAIYDGIDKTNPSYPFLAVLYRSLSGDKDEQHYFKNCAKIKKEAEF